MAEISDREKLQCVQREIKMRRRAYPRWVAEGRMTQEKADLELRTMESIGQDYQTKCAQDEPTFL